MKNQINDIVTLEWLQPLLNHQLSQISDGWQLSNEGPDYTLMSQHYHEIGGVLVMIKLPLLASIAAKLSQLADVATSIDLEVSVIRTGRLAHQLLKLELNHYVQVGRFNLALLKKADDELTRILAQFGLKTEAYSGSLGDDEQTNYAHIVKDINVSVPLIDDTATLTFENYEQLLTVWREQGLQLLNENENNSTLLQSLATTSQQLWQGATDNNQQRLWYLTELWLRDLADNDTPLPESYVSLLARLEQNLEKSLESSSQNSIDRTQSLEQQSTTDSEADATSKIESQHSQAPTSIVEALIVDIYIELSGLKQSSEQTRSILQSSQVTTTESLQFLTRVMGELETIIFGLDEPRLIQEPLSRIKEQLARRGWMQYAEQVSLVLSDLASSLAADDALADNQWQIERQLQELYSAIHDTEQAIVDQVGHAASYTPTNSDSTIAATTDDTRSDSDIVIDSSERLRELRITFEDIKQHFSDYLHQQQTHLLPSTEALSKVGDAFNTMGLPLASQVADKVDALFSQLRSQSITTLSWDTTQALAESLTSIELLLDYLARQIFDEQLLSQADHYIDRATELFNERLQTPSAQVDNYSPKHKPATNVLRYDDSGEVAPVIDQSRANLQVTDSESSSPVPDSVISDNNVTIKEDDDVMDKIDGKNAQDHNQIKRDNFDTDEDIRNIFIEEAEEVIADLNDFLPIWQEDKQDLTPLTEVRRSFHTLKGSGRMVGAFSISEMAWSIENLLNRLLDKTVPVSADAVTLVSETTEKFSVLLNDFASQNPPSFDPGVTITQSKNLLAGQALNQGLMDEKSLEGTATESQTTTAPVRDDAPVRDEDIPHGERMIDPDAQVTDAQQPVIESSEHPSSTEDNTDINDDGMSITDMDIPAVLVPFVEETENLATDASDADPDIKEIFIEEANEVLEEIVPLFEQWQKSSADLNGLADIRRGFHTLKGSGRMVGANYSAEVAWAIENMLNRTIEKNLAISADVKQLIGDVLAAYPAMVIAFEDSTDDYPAIVPLWIACANAYGKQLGDEFSYVALKDNWLSASDVSVAEIDTPVTADEVVTEDSAIDTTNIEDMLQKIHSVNETMAETPVNLATQSQEELEFCEIFIDEARELIDEVRAFIHSNQDNTDIEVSDDIVRAFHTLRAASGSSALVAISDISAIIEQSLEQLQQQDMTMSHQHLAALEQSVTLIEGYLNNYTSNVSQQDLGITDAQSQEDLAALQSMLEDSDDSAVQSDDTLRVSELLDEEIDGLLDAEWQLQDALSSADTEQTQSYIAQQIVQIERLAIITSSSKKFTKTLQALYSAYSYLSHHPLQAQDADVQDVLLAGHSQLVGLFDALAGSMSLKIEQEVLDNLNALAASDAPSSDTTEEEAASQPVHSPALPVQSSPALDLDIETIETDDELLEIFLEEAQELDQAITESFNEWREDIDNLDALKVLQRHLHTIKGGARMAGIRSIGDLTHEAESIYEAFVGQQLVPSTQWLAIMQMVQDTLSLQISHVIEHKTSFFATQLSEQLQQFAKLAELPESVTLIVPAPKQQTASKTPTAPVATLPATAEVADDTQLERIREESWVDGLPDPVILEVFLEEVDELVYYNDNLQAFINNVNDVNALKAIQRDLHTIKGGARMVSANGIADLAHEMGAIFKSLASRRRPATKNVLRLLVECHQWLKDAVYILGYDINPATPDTLIEALHLFNKNPDDLKEIPKGSLYDKFPTILATREERTRARSEQDMIEMPPMVGNFAEQEQSASSNEMIRISGGLIEHMINLSGESAINRARIDMGMSSLTNSIEEMGTTVQRLADQLRRMEIELEAQILSQIDDKLIENEDFDPLEMDQYSSLNQLSKSLTESASDLLDIKSTLLDKTRDSESLLLQLSRTQTELQDGLMNSRIVPFNSLTPRLERIVRQTASEVNKEVKLTVINADDEMDRTILERITSPLEHMLRNAVDHGIENTQERLKAGKERVGQITLEVLREGSEVVINLSDDGRGINVEAVRQKAIVQGLIDENDTSLTDVDIMQYIFNAGLSTTQSVTQISGRGVGMDVVISDIRQLGGVVSVMSEPNQGSRFTIRVPLTVAITDALVVRAADHHYAIPLVQIERVVRINPEKLYDYYQSNATTLNFEDNDYRVRYLNEILSGNKLNELIVSSNTSLPVIIIKNRTGQNIALQVDQIVGSRIEVVVKPLGRQLSHLPGISAATIMGDGSVMLILDLIALMRNAATLKDVNQSIKPQRRQIETQPTVLVVDDSVTVRKVTSRFLERQGISVAIAKDGIDAMEILQETTPDLMLLDIEMPRMDGFEVATQVRSNQRLQHIPIIMITSRTGEKHRKRALEIGVNDYMGKPFQENELLDKIQNLLGKQISLNHE